MSTSSRLDPARLYGRDADALVSAIRENDSAAVDAFFEKYKGVFGVRQDADELARAAGVLELWDENKIRAEIKRGLPKDTPYHGPLKFPKPGRMS